MTDQKDIWQFPCEFPIKIMGKATPEFESFVLATIRKHAPDMKENAIETRPSKDGNYTAMTVTVTATSKEQLDAIYSELSASKLVSVVL